MKLDSRNSDSIILKTIISACKCLSSLCMLQNFIGILRRIGIISSVVPTASDSPLEKNLLNFSF
ncbi:hypothetical protein DRO64_03705 [Candidatus Bathyarchaeota archaeon]|nr:MAG: hypothetical protein DRO64_03705 [Candidatus Bathyarchaeota archaeon]